MKKETFTEWRQKRIGRRCWGEEEVLGRGRGVGERGWCQHEEEVLGEEEEVLGGGRGVRGRERSPLTSWLLMSQYGRSPYDITSHMTMP